MEKPVKGKQFILLLILVFCVAGLCSCNNRGGSVVSADEHTTIAVAKPKNLPGLAQIISNFEQAHPDISVKTVDVSSKSDDRHNVYVSALSGKDSAVDLYWMDDTWVEEFAKYGYLLPLDGYIALEKEKYVPQAVDKFTAQQQLYCMPVALDMSFLYYRKDLIDEIPVTWEDICRLTKEMLPGLPEIDYGVDVCDEVEDEMVFRLIEFLNAKDNSTEQAVTLYKNLIDTNYVRRESEGKFFNTFKSGGSLFMYDNNSVLDDLRDDFSNVRGKVGVTLIPGGTGKKTGALLGGYGFGINRNSKHVPQAVQFLEYLQSEEILRSLSRDYSYMPALVSLYQDEMVLDQNPHFRGLLTLFPELEERNHIPVFDGRTNEVKKVLKNLLLESITVEEAVTRLENLR
uniref:Sugar ABC transporter substrate-binding protein n=1 Tax=uncultured Bacillota bacterium TaxID=344338 RepID=A0A650EME1_9FIRM|nr:sugar ABC transporter substrate-binding protein [uncultured Firmicutes bacterium]